MSSITKYALSVMICVCWIMLVVDMRSSHAASGKRSIAVYGDSQATDVFYALRSLAVRNQRFHVLRRTRGGTGLVRNDEYDWFGRMRRYLAVDKPDIVVIALGGNDRQAFHMPRRYTIPRFSKTWWREYKLRIQLMMSLLAGSKAKVYWLSLPRVRSNQMSRDYRKFNALYAAAARRNGIVFVDASSMFETANGGFKTFERDRSGKLQRLRRSDGIHFTDYAARNLATKIFAAIRQQEHR